ncbi:hypothetical protein DMENIID0001_101890 [Sergentomyia squamirostris]
MNRVCYFVLFCVPFYLNLVSPIAGSYSAETLNAIENGRRVYPMVDLKTILDAMDSGGDVLFRKHDMGDEKRVKRYTNMIPEVFVSNGIRDDHDGFKDGEGARKFSLDAVQESPWLIFLLTEKSNKYMTPRLGRDASGDAGVDSQRTRPPFAPRLGKKSLPFSPRLGRQMLNNYSDK